MASYSFDVVAITFARYALEYGVWAPICGELLYASERGWPFTKGMNAVADRKIQVPYLGKMAWGVEVEIAETIERPSEILLSDGTRLRLKSSVISAIRLDGEYTPDGSPMYVLNAAPVMTLIESPDKLKKKKK